MMGARNNVPDIVPEWNEWFGDMLRIPSPSIRRIRKSDHNLVFAKAFTPLLPALGDISHLL